MRREREYLIEMRLHHHHRQTEKSQCRQKKIDSSIKIEEELDLADCMINPDSPGRDYTGAACGTKYRLYAVVFHAGDAPNVGHYYATVRTTENQYVVRTGHGAAVREAKDASAKIVGRLPHGAVITLSEPMPAPE